MKRIALLVLLLLPLPVRAQSGDSELNALATRIRASLLNADSASVDEVLNRLHAVKEFGDQPLANGLASRFRYLNPCIELSVVIGENHVVSAGVRRCRTGRTEQMPTIIYDSLFWKRWCEGERRRLALPEQPVPPDSLLGAYQVLASPLYRSRYATCCGNGCIVPIGYLAVRQLVHAQAVALLNDLLASPSTTSRMFAATALQALRQQGVEIGTMLNTVRHFMMQDNREIEGCSGCTVWRVTPHTMFDSTDHFHIALGVRSALMQTLPTDADPLFSD